MLTNYAQCVRRIRIRPVTPQGKVMMLLSSFSKLFMAIRHWAFFALNERCQVYRDLFVNFMWTQPKQAIRKHFNCLLIQLLLIVMATSLRYDSFQKNLNCPWRNYDPRELPRNCSNRTIPTRSISIAVILMQSNRLYGGFVIGVFYKCLGLAVISPKPLRR